mmetsp:Transcript_26084/g.80586  ORF Transcript_26084/g.80586 Transcript_26084/m.80586 type:complete len:218 (-) Transcript_26084:118-771(-)
MSYLSSSSRSAGTCTFVRGTIGGGGSTLAGRGARRATVGAGAAIASCAEAAVVGRESPGGVGLLTSDATAAPGRVCGALGKSGGGGFLATRGDALGDGFGDGCFGAGAASRVASAQFALTGGSGDGSFSAVAVGSGTGLGRRRRRSAGALAAAVGAGAWRSVGEKTSSRLPSLGIRTAPSLSRRDAVGGGATSARSVELDGLSPECELIECSMRVVQ